MESPKLDLPSRIAGCESINTEIHSILNELGSQQIANAFLKSIKNQHSTDKLHLYHELHFGLHAHRAGHRVEYNKKLNCLESGRKWTPDWFLSDHDDELILEIATIHDSQEVMDLVEHLPEGNMQCFDVNEVGIHNKCVQQVENKFIRYKQTGFPIVVGLWIDFDAAVSIDELDDLKLFVEEFPESGLSGVLIADHTHHFRYIRNPQARYTPRFAEV